MVSAFSDSLVRFELALFLHAKNAALCGKSLDKEAPKMCVNITF